MTRPYRNRLGQPITDPAAIEARCMVTQMRRLITIGVKAGRPWDAATTIGDVARTSKMTAQQVLGIIREYGNAWLLGVSDSRASDCAAWTVYQDGE